jgi:hypothetical protein
MFLPISFSPPSGMMRSPLVAGALRERSELLLLFLLLLLLLLLFLLLLVLLFLRLPFDGFAFSPCGVWDVALPRAFLAAGFAAAGRPRFEDCGFFFASPEAGLRKSCVTFTSPAGLILFFAIMFSSPFFKQPVQTAIL